VDSFLKNQKKKSQRQQGSDGLLKYAITKKQISNQKAQILYKKLTFFLI